MHALSKYRAPLMGVAITLIMLFHSGIVLKDDVIFQIFRNGDIGVDMFAVLSAIGVFYSLQKNPSSIQFYKRRFFRIVPTYLLIAVPFALFRHYMYGASWGHVLALSLGLSTFRGDVTYWFVTYICICYFLSPFLIQLKRKIKIRFLLTVISIVFSVLLQMALKNRVSNCDLWILHFPVFVLGIDIADGVLKEDRIKNQPPGYKNVWSAFSLLCLVVCIMSIVWLITLHGTVYIKSFCYLASVIPLMLALSCVIEAISALLPVLQFLGTITLELYLLHEWICLRIVVPLGVNNWILTMLGILLAVLIAAVISKVLKFVRWLCVGNIPN